MPSSVQKSSISTNRRGSQKAHIPFNGDNLGVGTRTGIAIQRIERKDDGFEPFEDLLRQADKWTPPTKARAMNWSRAPPSSPAVEGAEMSMHIVDSVWLDVIMSRRLETRSLATV